MARKTRDPVTLSLQRWLPALASLGRDTTGSSSLQDVEAAHAVEQKDQPALVHEHVVARRPVGAGCRIGYEMRDFARRVRAADVNNAQAMGEPGGWNLAAGDLLDRLMAGGGLRLRRAVERLDLEGRDRHRPVFHGDVDDPEKRRWTGEQVKHVLVRHHQELAAIDLERHRHRAVGRAREWRAPVEAGDELGLGHVIDVEDDETALPVAGVEAIAEPQRVMAAVHGALPARRLAARDPLPRHPPAPDLLRMRRILQIEDAHDVADVTFEGRRAVEIAAVEVEAVHAGAARLPARDLARL